MHSFFKQGSPLPKLATTTVTNKGVSDYGGQPMSVIKVSYEGRGQKRKRDDTGGRGRGAGRGGRGVESGGRGGQWGREWPGGSKKYCRFALGKSNMDTQANHPCTPPYIYTTPIPPPYRPYATPVASLYHLCTTPVPPL